MEIPFNTVTDLAGSLWIKIPLILIATAVVSGIADLFIKKVVMKLASKTRNDFDDRIIGIFRKPVLITIILGGVSLAVHLPELPSALLFGVLALIKTFLIVLWASAVHRFAGMVLKWMEEITTYSIIQPRTLPMFDIISAVVIWGGAFYFIFLAWHIDVTGWLASAGVIGIAIGFAAKDTLANLFSGLFIIADAPYKLGDFIVLGTGERGVVTDIGIRSTRILTRDEVEIIIPNAVIANTKIINESGGPYEKMRVQSTVSVAYGSDIDKVKDILLSAAHSNEHMCEDPAPRVRFQSFGDSGLVFHVMGWVDRPVMRGRAIDSLNSEIYKRLNAAGIEIPYAKHDIYIKEAPFDIQGEALFTVKQKPGQRKNQ